MKSFSFFKLSTSLVAFAALVLTTSLQAAAPASNVENGKAEVKTIKGGIASYSSATGQGMLKAGQVLGEGATITTGPGVVVELWLGDNGQILRVIENTSVKIDELKLKKTEADTVASTKLTLNQGGLIGNVKKLSAASDYKVKYAEGVAGIRGTDWAILPGKGVICSEGTVTVTFIVNGRASAPITLSPGQVALPPLVPGGAPRILTLSPELAREIVALVKEFNPDPHNGPGDRNGPGRDVQVVVSANVGNNFTAGQGEQLR